MIIALPVMAQDKKNIQYEYKSYERIDLGSLEIKGMIIAPGDLSVKERERKSFDVNLFERKSFDKEIKQDIYNLR